MMMTNDLVEMWMSVEAVVEMLADTCCGQARLGGRGRYL